MIKKRSLQSIMMKILISFLFIGYITLSNLYAFSEMERDKVNSMLDLRIASEKETYKISDEIAIEFSIKNVSKEDVRILPWYSHNWIRIYDSKGNEVEIDTSIIYSLKVIPDKEDFVYLHPGESYKTTFKGAIKKERIEIDGQSQKIGKILIDFNDFGFIVDTVGEYIIKAEYIGDTLWKDEGEKRYNFMNIWIGEIVSNEVKIKIVE